MNVILLSGGSGTRLWPLSNEVRSKQFLKIFDTHEGKESMLQRVHRMIRSVDDNANFVIATSANQVPQIKEQIGDKISISIEPSRRDTFPAIALACAYLIKNGVNKEDSVVICPVDPLVDLEYYEKLERLDKLAKTGDMNLYLMGIRPTYPSEKYGYISVANGKVVSFKEKPNKALAEKYISEGALWNSGVFAFKINYILKFIEEKFGTVDYQDLFDGYDELEKISFDYAVAEKEKKIGYIEYEGEWKDLGTWNTLSEAMSDPSSGNTIFDNCSNTHIINELEIPLIALGINNSVICATPDGILISDKIMSASLKDYVKPNRPMYEKRNWGEYRVLDYSIQDNGNNSLVKHLLISEGQHISYQVHHHRMEIWTVVDGSGTIILNGETKKVSRGDSVTIPAGTKHAIKANEALHIVEVQVGDELTENDIEHIDYNWDNI